MLDYKIRASVSEKAVEFRVPELGRAIPLSGKMGRSKDQKTNLVHFKYFALSQSCLSRGQDPVDAVP